jgi:hypothetical protein
LDMARRPAPFILIAVCSRGARWIWGRLGSGARGIRGRLGRGARGIRGRLLLLFRLVVSLHCLRSICFLHHDPRLSCLPAPSMVSHVPRLLHLLLLLLLLLLHLLLLLQTQRR